MSYTYTRCERETKKQSLTPAEGLNAEGCSLLTGLGSGAQGVPHVVCVLRGRGGGGLCVDGAARLCVPEAVMGGNSTAAPSWHRWAPPKQALLLVFINTSSRISSSDGGPSGERTAPVTQSRLVLQRL